MVQLGEFIFNETITGSTSGTTARVRVWTNSNNVLEVGNVDGDFIVGETVVGAASGASHIIRVIDKEPDNDPYADNFDIETEADKILTFLSVILWNFQIKISSQDILGFSNV